MSRTSSSELFEPIFDQQAQMDMAPRMDEVANQRTKTIISGPIKEITSFPIWSTEAQLAEAKRIMGKTREAQRKLNSRNARLKMERKVNANFGRGDLLMTLTFPVGGQPTDDKDAKRLITNYLNRVKSLRKRKDIREALKYVYIIERTESERYGVRYHYHMIMSGAGMDRDEVEALWYDYTMGTCNTRRYQRQAAHLTGWAVYMRKFKATQAKATKRGWCASKNLIDPEARPTVSETKISRRRAQRMAMGGEDAARASLMKLYPGHEILEVSVKTSAFVQGVYIYAKMRMPDEKGPRGNSAGRKRKSLPHACRALGCHIDDRKPDVIGGAVCGQNKSIRC